MFEDLDTFGASHPIPQNVSVQKAKDGTLLIPSAFTRADGKPRFILPIAPGFLRDHSIAHLISREIGMGGYEYPTRAFFDTHVQAGDLFLDVGAHWGLIALTVAGAHPDATVLAIEASPVNFVEFLKAVAINQMEERIELICAAAGDRPGTAPLFASSTMGHSLYGRALGAAARARGLTVPVISIDDLLVERPHLSEKRVFLKIDVEGYETQVIEGAKSLLSSGRVAAVVWEFGTLFQTKTGALEVARLLARLSAWGFRHYRLPNHDLGGALLPFVPAPGCCNVFSFAEGFEHRASYCRPAGPIPPVADVLKGSSDPPARARHTRALMTCAGSDAARWGDPDSLGDGAVHRAEAAARHIHTGERVLDLGAGALKLAPRLPEGCSYHPVDLVPFVPQTIVVDLNRADVPQGEWDVACALELLEFIHEPARLLRQLSRCAARLLCTYRSRGKDTVDSRRENGWFHDYSEKEFGRLLHDSGWKVLGMEAVAGTTLFQCRRT